MKKLDLAAKTLLAELETSQDKESSIKNALKSFAADSLNLQAYLKDKNIEGETARHLMENQGIDFNGKTKKFF